MRDSRAGAEGGRATDPASSLRTHPSGLALRACHMRLLYLQYR